jgi:hypothetical protein
MILKSRFSGFGGNTRVHAFSPGRKKNWRMQVGDDDVMEEGKAKQGSKQSIAKSAVRQYPKQRMKHWLAFLAVSACLAHAAHSAQKTTPPHGQVSQCQAAISGGFSAVVRELNNKYLLC